MYTVGICPIILLTLLSLFVYFTHAEMKWIQDSYPLHEADQTDLTLPNKGGDNITTTIGDGNYQRGVPIPDLKLAFSHAQKAFGNLESKLYIYIYIIFI